MYRCLPGLYLQFWNLKEAQRFVLRNMLVLMIAPFTSSEVDMAQSLMDETLELGQGKIVNLAPGKDIHLVMFPMAFTRVMPQQNSNCGIVSHKGKHGCQICVIKTQEVGNLDIDTKCYGQYEAEHNYLFKILSKDGNQGDHQKSKRLAQIGQSLKGHVFGQCFLYLNPFTAYPHNPMQSELRLAKYFHSVILCRLINCSQKLERKCIQEPGRILVEFKVDFTRNTTRSTNWQF